MASKRLLAAVIFVVLLAKSSAVETCIGETASHKENKELATQVSKLLSDQESLKADVSDLLLKLWFARDQLRELRSSIEQVIPSADKSEEPVESVDRRSDLTFEEFMTSYALKSKPVIITDLQASLFSGSPWDLNFFTQVCGQKTVPLLRHQSDAAAWGRLVPAGSQKLLDFVEDIHKKDPDQQEPKYLHDWSLPQYCPEVFEQSSKFQVPKYFAGDLLQQLDNQDGFIFRDEWPSLFIGPKGSQSALHVDSFGSNFWMYLIAGRKRWRFFPETDRSFLYEDRAKQTFDVDAFKVDFEKYPLAYYAHPIECILEPGEVLFVPSGTPHQVSNLDETVAMSVNYIDQSNYERVIEEIGRESKAGNKESNKLLHGLVQLSEDARRPHKRWNAKQKNLSWQDFKRQG